MPTQPDSMTKDEGRFEREERFIVIKRKRLSAVQETAIRAHMDRLNIGTVECVVVENDWPEYEAVWQMIEDRVTGRPTPSSADNALRAMEIACRAVEQYGEGDEQEAQAARLGNLWKDHPAYQAALAALSPSSGEPALVAGHVTTGAYDADDFGPVGDTARHIASCCEGEARANVYRAAKIVLAAPVSPTPVEAVALRETCEHLESQLDLGHATIFLTPGKARTILAALSQPTPVEAGALREEENG